MSDFRIDVDKYLARLGLTGPMAPNEETLCTLTRAHLEMVPFENLTVMYEHQEPSLEPEDLFRKVVLDRRGGWCFELNKLFYLLLQEMGYHCTPVPCRIVLNREEIRPVTHRATLVRVNGRKWFIDVGYGGQGPKGAVCLDEPGVQHIHGDDFYVTHEDADYPGETIVGRIDDGVRRRVMTHREVPYIEQDYVTLNGYFAFYPRSPFKLKRVLYRCTPKGWINLVENTFTEKIEGNVQTVELQTEDQIQEIIEKRFELFVKPLPENP